MSKPSPQQQRAQEAREKKLAEIQAQIEGGSLTVRQMTPEERSKFPKPPDTPRKQRRRP